MNPAPKQAYRNGSHRPTPNRRTEPETQEEREIATEVLTKNADAIAIEDAISRAPRSRPDAADRIWRIGAHVGKMCRQLVFWEGKGQDDDNRVHKTAREWFESEAGLTRVQLRTATRIAVEENLLEVEQGKRPSDQQTTVYYRLNMWTVARLVVASEVENTERLLEREGRKRRRDELEEKRRKLERARDDLAMVDGRDSGNPEPPEEHGQFDRTPPTISPNPPSNLTRPPSQIGGSTEEHSGNVSVDHTLSVRDDKIGKGVEILQTIDGFDLDADKARRLVSMQAGLYPRLNPLVVCRRYRDHAERKAKEGDQVRSHRKYLPGFFERQEQVRASERVNPHSPQGVEAKEKSMRADWYAAVHGAPEEQVQGWIDAGYGHHQIEAALGVVDDRRSYPEGGNVEIVV